MRKTSKHINELLTLRSHGEKNQRKCLCRIKNKVRKEGENFKQFLDIFRAIEKETNEYVRLDGRLKYDLKNCLVINNL